MHGEGLGLPESFLGQKLKNGGSVKLFEAIFQFKLIGAHLECQVLEFWEIPVEVVKNHILDFPNHPNIFLAESNFWGSGTFTDFERMLP